MGIYQSLLDHFSQGKSQPGFMGKAAIGIFSGGVAAYIGTPAEVALIRMTADGKLPPAEKRGYKNVFNALVRIVKEEGTATLWKVNEFNLITTNIFGLMGFFLLLGSHSNSCPRYGGQWSTISFVFSE